MNRPIHKHKNLTTRLAIDLKANKSLYLLALPVVIFYFIFNYIPMLGIIMAFQDFSPMAGLFGSDFVGFQNFVNFWNSYFFSRTIANTLILSGLSLVFEFTAPIILALVINEVTNRKFTNFVKLVSCFPNFISLVIVCGIIRDFTSSTGIITQFAQTFGYSGVAMLQQAELFRPIYIISGIWSNIGWQSIIYIGALMAIDESLYEAARIDGAGRWNQLWAVTLPGIMSTIIVMFLLRIANIMNVSFDKIILLYNPATYETSDVISSFVYRKGLQEFEYGYAAAVGLFNSVINLAFLLVANRISKKVNNTGLW